MLWNTYFFWATKAMSVSIFFSNGEEGLLLEVAQELVIQQYLLRTLSLYLHSSYFCLFVLNFLTSTYVGTQFPDQGLNPCPLSWKHGVLTTGTWGKSPGVLVFVSICSSSLPGSLLEVWVIWTGQSSFTIFTSVSNPFFPSSSSCSLPRTTGFSLPQPLELTIPLPDLPIRL